jgi:hypothetical protein
MGTTEKKIAGALGLAALAATGLGAAGIGPLAGLLSGAGGVGGATAGSLAGLEVGMGTGLAEAGAAGAGSSLGWSGLLGGAGKMAGGAAASAGANRLINPPMEMTSTQFGQVPQMGQMEDPMEFFRKIQAMGKGGVS